MLSFRSLRRSAAAAVLAAALVTPGSTVRVDAQAAAKPAERNANTIIDPVLLSGLEYRSLGFSRGGRVTAVAGVTSDPMTYYFGSTGGGIWKTRDAGMSWTNVSDTFFEAGSIGAVSVAESDPNVIYVGTGSACPRGNISAGVGMYRSTDAGKTWKHVGLRDAGQVGRIQIHPGDANLVYAAVLGNVFGPSEERGVYRSKDGGATWQKVHFVSRNTGAVDLAMDPSNPRVLYAAMWTVERKPWTIDSGSKEGGLFKSTDGGDTWTKLAGGLPNDVMMGKIGVTVSPANPDRVWAVVEAADGKGGVYRSDNAGTTWQRTNNQRMLQQRAWYYMHIFADPRDPDTVYGLNVQFHKSTDGGRTFTTIRVPHGDNHDLWINRNNPDNMIYGDDGGAAVTFTGGRAWTSQMNQPTAEIYRVTTDTRFPYRVYGAQQDNSTASVPSFAPPSFLGGGPDFYDVGGCESGHIAVDPRHPNLVYAGCYGGVVTKTDTDTGLSDSVRVYPELQTGHRAADMKYRFQWNFPIRISRHDPDTVYVTSQHVHRSKDAGHSWEAISPDLTRNDKAKQEYSGSKGITRDNTGVEVYGVVFAFEESPTTAGLLWAGTDDGKVHVSRDGGGNWSDVTPRDIPDFGTVNSIDPSTHDPGRAAIAVHRYRENDFTPYIFLTDDYGKSWKRLTSGRNGIPAGHFVRVVREDPSRKGLLYAGTEYGMYVSFDGGAHWQPFQLNLPVSPVTDLQVYRKDLVVSTQGRAFWAIDDLSPLHQLKPDMAKQQAVLLDPRDAPRSGARGASIYYYFAEAPKEEVTVEILDKAGAAVAKYSAKPGGGPGGDGLPPGLPPEFAAFFRGPRVTLNKGLNRFTWNMTHDAVFTIPQGTVLWGGFFGNAGPRVVPGTYQVKVTSGNWSQTHAFEVQPDPRLKTTQAEYEAQLRLSREIGGTLKTLYEKLASLREIKKQATDIGERVEKAGKGDEIAKAAKAMNEKLGEIEKEMTQVQGEGGQDALNFPGMLDNQILEVYSEAAGDETRVSQGTIQRWADLQPEITGVFARYDKLVAEEAAKFNALVKSKNVEPLIVKAP